MVPVRCIPGTIKILLYACAVTLVCVAGARAQDVAPVASAQEISGPPPAHIGLVDGAATVERDGQSRVAIPNVPFVPGDRLRTTTGRVEVLFPDGTALDVDQDSGVDLQSPTLLRLLSGRLILVVAGASDPAAAMSYQIDTPAASARTDGAGEYRVAALNGRSGIETELAVLRGSASLATERGSMPVRAGERTVARDNETPSFPQAFNSARFDAFDQWSAEQQNARTGATSPQYLPQDLQMYGGTLDRYGAWEYTAPYGYAWYPSVTPDWQPYYAGYWAPYRPWGWTWIGLDVWSWPTHHYGRWGFARNRWFWMPGRTWGPAWVSWASAPGYVSWCPLGFDGRPVFGISAGFSRARAGWTILPRESFGHYARVDHFAVRPDRIPVAATSFVAHRRSPIDVPQSAPIVNLSHSAGHVVESRQSAVERRQSIAGSHQSASPARPSTTPTPREFTPPLPDSFRAPERAVPRNSNSPGPAPASGYPPYPPRANRDGGYPATPHSTQSGQAVPRGYSPPNEPSPRAHPTPPAAPAPPTHLERQAAPPPPPRAEPRAERPSGSSAPAAVPRSGPPPSPPSTGSRGGGS